MTDTGLFELADSADFSNWPLLAESAFGKIWRHYWSLEKKREADRGNVCWVKEETLARSGGNPKRLGSGSYRSAIVTVGTGSLNNFQIHSLTSLIGQDQDQPIPGSGKTLILYVDRYQEGESWIDQLHCDKVNVMAKFSQIPVGGRLSLFIKKCEQTTSDCWVWDLKEKRLQVEIKSNAAFPGHTRSPGSCATTKFNKEKVNSI